jgi:CxxC motif-containing protein
MKKEIICISCPIGCHLSVEFDENTVLTRENILVQNNRCARGEIYGREEILSPKRVVTATCAVDSELMNRIPVKTTGPILRGLIDGLLEELYKVKIQIPVTLGDVIIEDYKNTGINVICTRTLLI